MVHRRSIALVLVLGLGRLASAQVQVQEVVASDAKQGAFFGMSVAAEQTTVAVGAPTDKPPGMQMPVGAVYVFELVGGSLREVQKLVPPVGLLGSEFGIATRISGDWIAVGADAESSFKGAVYMFQRQGGTWVQRQRLVASDGVSGDGFGLNVDLWEDRLIVGAHHKSTVFSGDGAAYVFELQGAIWVQAAKLTASNPGMNDILGLGVAIRGDRAVAGAPGPAFGFGYACIFEREIGGWIEKQRIVPSPLQPEQSFGTSITMEGDLVLVGGPSTDGQFSNQGAIFVFEHVAGSWSQVQDLWALDRTVGFPRGLSLINGRLLAGAGSDQDLGTNSGSAFLFDLSGGQFVQKGKLLVGNGLIGDSFGTSVALLGSHAVGGAHGHDGACPSLPNCNSGAAYLFRLPLDSEQYCSCPSPAGPCGNHDDHGGCLNSTGPNAQGAVLSAAGTGSFAADDFELSCLWLPASTPSLLFMGPSASQTPFGDGRLCIGGGPAMIQRYPVAISSAAGALSFGPGLGAQGLANFPRAAQLVPGSTWNFQVWYRDPTGPCGTVTNLSNAVSVTFRD